jgi:hypothetical protein
LHSVDDHNLKLIRYYTRCRRASSLCARSSMREVNAIPS